MKYTAFMGDEDFLYSGESVELSEKIFNFMISIADENNSTGTFEITEEVINGVKLYWTTVCFFTWAEALFLIQFHEYDWELLEESE